MQVDMSKILYNEKVMGDLDYYEDIDSDLIVYDDSGEWYNQYNDIDGSEAGG